jgi:filamentous hemagglutinin family protein
MTQTKFGLSFLTLTNLFISTQIVSAQTYQPSNRLPLADNTLDTQISGVGNNFNITGGLIRGQTLFHSFTNFSVPTNGQANFHNPVGNRDILTRVTGTLFSDINGLVDTNGANFFLINPNGIVFGPNAKLTVGKAFVGSTANGLTLLNGQGQSYVFGTNPGNDAPLLTINPSAVLNISQINLSANLAAGLGIINYGTLKTNNNSQYIGLIGGNVTLDGRYGSGQIVAPGGRVDLGGLNSTGAISIDRQGLVFTGSNFTRSNVSILNGAQINVAATQSLENVNIFSSDIANLGSRINVNTNNLKIVNDRSTTSTNPSNLIAGLNSNAGVKATSTGGISINATGQILLDNGTINNNIETGSVGQLGDINIRANSLNIANGSRIVSQMNGTGNAGNINLKTTKNIDISGTSDPTLLQGDLKSNLSIIATGSLGKGDSGKVFIDTLGDLSIINRGGISSFVNKMGNGNTQGVTINANNLNIANLSTIESSIFAGTGNAGNINIRTTGNLNISGTTNRSLLQVNSDKLSFISSTNSARGDAGKITIDTNGSLSISNLSKIISSINPEVIGNSQGINITAGNINISNFSNLIADNSGRGNAGNIDIKTTGDLNMSGTDNRSIIAGNAGNPLSSISSVVKGQGNTGKVTIEAEGNVTLDNLSVISSSVNGIGNSQGVNISAKNIHLSNLGDIQTSIFGGVGNAGNIDIKTTGDLNIVGANDFALLQIGNKVQPLSEISSFTNGIGNAGKITINTLGNLSIANRGGIFATILEKGVGNSPGIKINASNFNLSNTSGIDSVSYSGGTGIAGNIDITSKGDVNLTSSSRISSSNQSQGEAANILVTGNRIRLNSSSIVAQASGSKGGNIQLTLNDQLLLRNTSSVSSTSDSAGKNGNGGNITINSPFIVAAPGNNDISANAYAGNGGQVNITNQGLFGIQYRSTGQNSPLTNDITASSTFGQSGIVNITRPEVDITSGLTPLPDNVTDPSNQVNPNCSAKAIGSNSFTVVGRGGIPPNPQDTLNEEQITANWVKLNPRDTLPTTIIPTPTQLPKPLIEAQGWRRDLNGDILLVAQSSSNTQVHQSQPCVSKNF